MKKHSNDFGNDSVPGLVLRTSIPFMFAQFVNVLYSIVDRIYIGNIPTGRKGTAEEYQANADEIMRRAYALGGIVCR